MKPIDFILAAAAVLIGMLVAYSTGRWAQAIDEGQAQAQQAKKELIQSAGLFELHNKIYQEVGPQEWEARVKPQFMQAVTYATVRESGDLFPDWPDMVKWVRAHPGDARRLLVESAGAKHRP